ncbi:VOC family protein [Streptomyces sp. LX-29]|uniref:VOC family protein n=1 Tax=Streptomyces sp. LX-29 TaxID=2900152 RepID=UPI00240DBC17|nr:VOC family protein [Streptomyces sp. LX-29]WFB10719.1 VOC family protein [Streptomyces sp. LX-29]
MQKITPCLWFDTQAEEAVAHYTSIFPDSRVVDVQRFGEAGPRESGMVMLIVFELAGQEFQALNGGPEFTFNEALSLSVDCASQEEVDELWARLTEGGEPGPCGWLKDRFGVSWQIVPSRLTELMSDPDPAKVARVTRAMLGMGKIDIKAAEDAYEGR